MQPTKGSAYKAVAHGLSNELRENPLDNAAFASPHCGAAIARWVVSSLVVRRTHLAFKSYSSPGVQITYVCSQRHSPEAREFSCTTPIAPSAVLRGTGLP